ncbi:MAG TPA: lipocalin-like domain-containing protein [Gemmatimonadaceae bacterium]|nr:lipocalin-like domain-containing protein [Gemmatimonadaceae bacterium]
MTAKDFVGTWRLVSMEARSSTGAVNYPLGQDCGGLIIYTADGYMSVVIYRAGRERFGTRDIMAGTEAQLAGAARSYVSYAGRYQVRGDRVHHDLEASFFPDWVGTTQERIYELKGSRLTLSTDPIPLGGAELRVVLIWERVKT